MPPTDLYLVRHAQSTWNAVGRWQGQADPPLSEHGNQQAEHLARAFPTTDVAYVVASDLVRARTTALPLATRFGLDLDVDPDLREIDVGTWSGRTREEIRAEDAPALDRYFSGQVGWSGGETYLDLEVRTTRVAARLASLDVDGAVVAITHGGTLRALVLGLLELDPALRSKLTGIDHTAITHLVRGALGGWRLASFNRTVGEPPAR